MRPVSLRLLARRLQLSPSTVSRALSHRTIRLPWGAEVPMIAMVPGQRRVLQGDPQPLARGEPRVHRRRVHAALQGRARHLRFAAHRQRGSSRLATGREGRGPCRAHGHVPSARDVMRPVAFALREEEDAWNAARRLFEQGQTGAPELAAAGRRGVLQADVAGLCARSSRRRRTLRRAGPIGRRAPDGVGAEVISRVLIQVPEDMPLDEVERHSVAGACSACSSSATGRCSA